MSFEYGEPERSNFTATIGPISYAHVSYCRKINL
jgi:hypothetical protein